MRLIPFLIVFLFIYLEITIFIKVASVLGVLVSLLLVILTSLIGVSMVRSQGLATMIAMQQKLAMGENPAQEMVKSVSLLLAGFLLILPGFFSDFLALLLLLPPVQKLLTLKMMPFIRVKRFTHEGQNQEQGGRIIEGEFEKKDNDKLK